jgi:hypothetical protein
MALLLSSSNQRAEPAVCAQLLAFFIKILSLQDADQPPGKSSRGFYRRIWCPVLTLWYMIWQRLQTNHTLDAVVVDLRRGGADALGLKNKKPLSQRVLSRATTAFSKARKRLPLDWVKSSFSSFGQLLAGQIGQAKENELPVQLWDGSTLRMRPLGDLPKNFPPHRTRRKKSYWCVARVVVGFCASTGLALAAEMASLHVSEQALAVGLLLASTPALHLGDRNFGVWRVVRAAVQSGGQGLFRMTGSRAKKLAAGRRLKPGLDLAVQWAPSAHDQVDPGLEKKAVAGRLVVVRAHRAGYRTETLFLFTTLTDAVAYPPERLLALYGLRWQVELNFRTVKATMSLAQLEVKSADLAQKELYAGLMAYNLVRGLMGVAARSAGCRLDALSFAAARTQLTAALAVLWLSWLPDSVREEQWRHLIQEVGRARLPRRKKPRPSEPRQQCYSPRPFPPLRISRAQARAELKKQHAKG